MMVKTKAIVLRPTKVGENRLITELYTEQLGRCAVACTVSSSGKGKMKKQFFEPLTIIEADMDRQPSRNIATLKDIRPAHPYRSLHTDGAKMSIAFFLSEFLLYTTRGEENNDALFRFVETSLHTLDDITTGYANFHLVFMMRLCRFIGFYPDTHRNGFDKWFDLMSARFTATRPKHYYYLNELESNVMNTILRMSYDNMHLFRFTRDERNRCTDLMLRYYRLHLPNFPEMKTLEVLRSL